MGTYVAYSISKYLEITFIHVRRTINLFDVKVLSLIFLKFKYFIYPGNHGNVREKFLNI